MERRCRLEAIGAVDILPLKPGEELGIKVQKRIAKQTASVIALISVLLIIIGLGFNSASEDVSRAYTYGDGPVGSELLDLAWLFAWLGIIGFLVAGLAYLLSLPTPKKEKTTGEEKEKGLVPEPKPQN